jgi:hypothetical protein
VVVRCLNRGVQYSKCGVKERRAQVPYMGVVMFCPHTAAQVRENRNFSLSLDLGVAVM